MGSLSPTELIVIIGGILLLFCGKKIPELMKGIGSGIKEFKNATKEENSNVASKNTTDTKDKSEQ